MDSASKISPMLENAWSNIKTRWKGDATDAFYQKYIVSLSETAVSFESACEELESISSNLLEEMKRIEQSLTNI